MISNARGSHVSPGIYTEEGDVTYSVKSLGVTSLGLVGETLYGPAFQRIEIENWGEYVDYFGGTSTEKFGNGMPKYELPYIAKSYLEESKRLNVVRVLGLSGYNAGPVWPITYNGKIAVVLRSKMDITSVNEDCNITYTSEAKVKSIDVTEYAESISEINCGGPNGNSINDKELKFQINVTLSNDDTKSYNVSLNPNSSNYIYKVLGNRPNAGKAELYVEAVYENAIKYSGEGIFNVIDKNGLKDFDNYMSAYRYAQTPWIVSDAIVKENETTMRKLFKFVTISDGDIANYQIKVSIQNIKPEEGTFDVIVRDFNDTDSNPIILERFSKCNLVEGDVNYIAYRIGDLSGGFEAKSKYILVEMAKDNEDFSNSIPAGFIGYPMPKYAEEYLPSDFEVNYSKTYNPSVKSKRYYFGASNIDTDIFSFKGVDTYDLNSMDAIPTKLTKGFHMDSRVSNASVDEVSGFYFESVSSENTPNGSYEPTFNAAMINKTIYKDINLRKFTVCFYGGFDGWDLNRSERSNTDDFKSTKYKEGFYKPYDSNANNVDLPLTANTSDYYAYLAGARVFANPQDADINIFATPGIDWDNNSLLTEEIIDIIEDAEDGRGGDALYIMSSPNEVDANDIARKFEEKEFNSSYVCTYFPWVMYYDKSNKRYLDLPATKDVVRNMAHTDNTSYPWFAPAGMQRGNVDCIKAVFKTSLADGDALYEVGINPIKSFAQDGVKIWGNKTAYKVDSPLNRINVRRLMIRVKKLITEAAKNLIFEQYDEALEAQFKGIVEPILADVKSNRGIVDYRVITECTPETRDQHILPAKILIKPTQSLEYISISFVVYPESVSFEN